MGAVNSFSWSCRACGLGHIFTVLMEEKLTEKEMQERGLRKKNYPKPVKVKGKATAGVVSQSPVFSGFGFSDGGGDMMGSSRVIKRKKGGGNNNIFGDL